MSLEMTWKPNGRAGNVTLSLIDKGQTIALDSCNVLKMENRKTFMKGIMARRPELDAASLESRLLEIASEVAREPEAPPDMQAMPEVDAAAIVRPERFIRPEVSGLAVPSMVTIGDKVAGRWNLYLQWADGTRERRPMAAAIELPDGRRLFVHPEPCEPSPSTKPGWSAAGRKRWLEGEPPPEPADVFKNLAAAFSRFIDLPATIGPGVTATAICWSLLSYVFHTWDAVPYLFIGGPLGSGKSRFFEVLSRLVFRPLSSSNMTGAALFRTLHGQGGCLLLDEAERLKNTQDPATAEILSMLLAGYKRGGTATRLEPMGDNGFKTVSYDVYSCKALACIAGLPPALASRCIPVTMFRSPPGSEKPRRRIDASPGEWQGLRDSLHALALGHGPAWIELPERADVCPTMSGRQYELWQPLLAIASWFQEHGAKGLLKLLQEHALGVIDASRDDTMPDTDETLLRLLVERRQNLDMPQPKEILDAAREQDNVTFRQWSPRGVANVFRRYGVVTSTLHGRKVYRTDMSDLLRIQATYGLSLGIDETPVHPG